MTDDATPVKRVRGPQKTPTLFLTSIRLPREVMDYFNTHHPYKKQEKMREVLLDYVRNQGESNGNT